MKNATFSFLFTHKRYFSFQVGLTPLHLAAESGHKELVGLLVASYKASVDALTLVRVCVLFMYSPLYSQLVCYVWAKSNESILSTGKEDSTAFSRGEGSTTGLWASFGVESWHQCVGQRECLPTCIIILYHVHVLTRESILVWLS